MGGSKFMKISDGCRFFHPSAVKIRGLVNLKNHTKKAIERLQSDGKDAALAVEQGLADARSHASPIS
jgi:alkaline phosphatase